MKPEYVPTMELQFQLTEEFLGESYYTGQEVLNGISQEEIIEHNAKLLARIVDKLDYAIIMMSYGVPHFPGEGKAEAIKTLISIRAKVAAFSEQERLIICHGDVTYAIPKGENVLEFVYALSDHPEEMKSRAQQAVDDQLERCKLLVEGGYDGFALCGDYAFNRGSFLSPSMFRKFVIPYLASLIEGQRKLGAYVIKDTDGDIMGIIEQIIDCGPHAIHSLDPQAGVDIARIKELYGNRICLIGNVNCALLQTGTYEEILESVSYAMEHGKRTEDIYFLLQMWSIKDCRLLIFFNVQLLFE